MKDAAGGPDPSFQGYAISVVTSIAGSLLPDSLARKDNWRVRAVSLLCCGQVASVISDNKNAARVREAVMTRRLVEIEPKVRQVCDIDGKIVNAMNERLGYTTAPLDLELASALDRDSFSEAQAAVEAKVHEEMSTFRNLQEEADKELDPVKKQQKVLICREKNLALRLLLSNVSSISKKFDVLVEFVGVMTNQLARMDDKLDVIQNSVCVLLLQFFKHFYFFNLYLTRQIPTGYSVV